ncbi:MAG TPA: hypothetical protein VFN68_12430 [Acidimicrobiales bacterium]|nr:hypothetical protein [Acidimicrobiales bacterium]
MSSLKRMLVTRIDRYARAVADETATRMTQQLTAHLDEIVRSEMKELARMLRQQGDAADEVAETFGRTLTRLSSEIESLGAALRDLQAGRADAQPSAHP